MKKILVVLAAAVLVLSFAGAAFAIHAEIPAETAAIVAKGSTQITLGGEIRVRNWWASNRGTASGVVTGMEAKDQAWYDHRVRLSVDAQVAPNVKGYLMLETGTADEFNQGGYLISNADKYKWGNFNSKPNTSMGIIESYILYTGSGLFGFNSGLKIGHMPLKLSEGYFFDHTQLGDDAIVFFMDPTKDLHIGLLTVKFAGDGGHPATIPALGVKDYVGVTSDNTDDLDGYVALMTYKINKDHTVGFNYTYLNLSDLRFSHQNLGLHAAGNIGNFGYAAEADFQFGKVGDSKFRGDAVYLKGTYKMDALTFSGQFGWASGDNNSHDDKIDRFIPYVGNIHTVGGAFMYDYIYAGASGGVARGIENTTFYNLGLDYKASKDLSFTGNGFIFRASKTPTGVSKNAGWELDGRMTYQIAKNLKYIADLGYFDPGKFYDDTLHVKTKGSTAFRGTLSLSF